MKTENLQAAFETPQYKRSRRAYMFECTFEYFVSLLVTEAFLANLLSEMGISDALIGIISSFASLSFIVQFFSIFVVKRIANTKRFAILFHSTSQLFFAFLYVIPFLPCNRDVRELLVIISVLTAYFGNYFVTSIIYQWGNSFVFPYVRGAFGATKEMISLATGMTMTLTVGYVLDRFDANGNVYGGFLFSAIAIFIFSVCDFICLMLIKNRIKTTEERSEIGSVKDILKNTLGVRSFRNVVVLNAIFKIAQYMTVGFLGTYMINDHELAFSVGTVQLIAIAGNLTRFFASRPIGKYSDRRSYAKGIELGLILLALSFAACVFTTPSTRYLIILHMMLFCASAAGTTQNFFSVTYGYVEEKYLSSAMAITNSIGGVCGFLASLLASRLLKSVQEGGNTFLGISLYGQQLLGLISFAISIGAVLFCHFVVEKQKSEIR